MQAASRWHAERRWRIYGRSCRSSSIPSGRWQPPRAAKSASWAASASFKAFPAASTHSCTGYRARHNSWTKSAAKSWFLRRIATTAVVRTDCAATSGPRKYLVVLGSPRVAWSNLPTPTPRSLPPDPLSLPPVYDANQSSQRWQQLVFNQSWLSRLRCCCHEDSISNATITATFQSTPGMPGRPPHGHSHYQDTDSSSLSAH
jgi:hypothetical protein